tara:strand:+ start:123 stop:410 length:288 start_codon:yes stop_codon:yes gene_type:complete
MVLNNPPKNFKENKPLYKPVKSSNSKKKGMVYVKRDGNKKLIHFGDSNMKDFTQHKDKERRKNYLARSAGITNKDGVKTANNKNYSNYWARKVLW